MTVSCQAHAIPQSRLTLPLTLFFAASVGVIVMNLFAAQPLAGPIGASLGISPGLAAMVPQLGYAAGLVLLVPLADLVENRRLIAVTLAGSAASLALVAVARWAGATLAALFMAGATSSVIQMLVPMAAGMASETHRGRAIGNVMSGVMLGILLSRPVAGLLAGLLGWRGFYGVMAVVELMLAMAMWRQLPMRAALAGGRYIRLLASLGELLRREAVLQRNALSAGLVMGAFSAFWTCVALLLAQAPFGFSLEEVALFALAGISGVVATPVAGWAGDRGIGRAARLLGHLVMIAAWIGLGAAGGGWGGFSPEKHRDLAVLLLAAGAAALDAGVVCDQTIGRRAVNLLNPAARGRLNGLFVGLFFVGGAVGSALSGLLWQQAGWDGVCVLGLAFTLAAMWVGSRP
jgi:predicted MFS family arabinose efflux permease